MRLHWPSAEVVSECLQAVLSASEGRLQRTRNGARHHGISAELLFAGTGGVLCAPTLADLAGPSLSSAQLDSCQHWYVLEERQHIDTS